jgi:hypothetical protein
MRCVGLSLEQLELEFPFLLFLILFLLFFFLKARFFWVGALLIATSFVLYRAERNPANKPMKVAAIKKNLSFEGPFPAFIALIGAVLMFFDMWQQGPVAVDTAHASTESIKGKAGFAKLYEDLADAVGGDHLILLQKKDAMKRFLEPLPGEQRREYEKAARLVAQTEKERVAAGIVTLIVVDLASNP